MLKDWRENADVDRCRMGDGDGNCTYRFARWAYMDPLTLETTYLPHLRGQFSNGSAILFLRARLFPWYKKSRWKGRALGC
jgi:hypothetical protein